MVGDNYTSSSYSHHCYSIFTVNYISSTIYDNFTQKIIFSIFPNIKEAS